MQNILQPRCLNDLVKGTWLRNVRHDDHIQVDALVFVRIADLLGLVFGSNSGGDLVALLQQLL